MLDNADNWDSGYLPKIDGVVVEDRGYSTPCWIYARALTNRKGYGPYRKLYERLRGPVPEGLVLDHLCRVTACVNPDHLEPVTQRENLMRGKTEAARKRSQTHCHRGHPFDEQNTQWTPDGRRQCRACVVIRVRNHRQRHK